MVKIYVGTQQKKEGYSRMTLLTDKNNLNQSTPIIRTWMPDLIINGTNYTIEALI